MTRVIVSTTTERGKWAEDKALDFLEVNGLNIIERNYRSPKGEIDLIMEDNNIIVFIEVRYRANSRYVSAIESIDSQKCARVIATSQHYIQYNRTAAKMTSRFDVIVITGPVTKFEIGWIKNAFQA